MPKRSDKNIHSKIDRGEPCRGRKKGTVAYKGRKFFQKNGRTRKHPEKIITGFQDIMNNKGDRKEEEKRMSKDQTVFKLKEVKDLLTRGTTI